MGKFNVGDKVIANRNCFSDIRVGNEYTVLEVDENIDYLTLNGSNYAHPASEFDAVPVPESKFKIGDKVTFGTSGEVATVINLDDNETWPIRIVFSGGAEGLAKESELTLYVEPTPEPEPEFDEDGTEQRVQRFNKGDRVIVKDDGGTERIGTVERYDESWYLDLPYLITIDGNEYDDWFLDDQVIGRAESERKDHTDLIARTDALLEAYVLLYNRDTDDNLTVVTRELRDALVEESYRG